MDTNVMAARCEQWFKQIADLRLEINTFFEHAVRTEAADDEKLALYNRQGELVESLAVSLDHLQELLDALPTTANQCDSLKWMFPDSAEVYAHREKHGDGVYTTVEKLTKKKIAEALPTIIATKDFNRLAQVVEYLAVGRTNRS